MQIRPAILSLTSDGTPFAPQYDDVYHSRAGAVAQARHVFLGGNQLPFRWANRRSFVILETGFGLGLNFLTTWDCWKSIPENEKCNRLHFVSVEKHPLQKADLQELLKRYQNELPGDLLESLVNQWPILTQGTHRLEFEYGRIVLTLILGDAERELAQLSARADAIFLDGFSPSKNPDIWSDKVCQTLTRLSGLGTTLATWSVNGALRRRLNNFGFDVSLTPGFAQKRQMLCATFKERKPHPEPPLNPGHALIIGAGLAGTATAERLAARGWKCTILEANVLASGASGNRAGIIRPQPAADDNLLSRLTRTGFLTTLNRLNQLRKIGLSVDFDACGVLHLAKDSQQESLMQRTVSQLGLPEELLSWISPVEASAIASLPLQDSGWWFPTGGWVDPADYCAKLLAASGAKLIEHAPVSTLKYHPEGWLALHADGSNLAQGDIVILANATQAPTLASSFSNALPIRPARGQTTVYPSPPGPAPSVVICRSGYWTPSIEGRCTSGASFIINDTDPSLRLHEHSANLKMLRDICPSLTSFPETNSPEISGKVGIRPVVPDRMPLVGQVPTISISGQAHLSRVARSRVPGLYINSGYGARGIVLATLCADLLASQINGEPLPLPKDLIRAIDPMRYAHKKQLLEETISEN